MSQQSLASRAVAAVALMIGFYLLALTIAGALLFIPYAEWHWGDRIHIKLAIGCIVSAAVIVWSILPRIDRFKAPGPRLEPGEHRQLFDVLHGGDTKLGPWIYKTRLAIGRTLQSLDNEGFIHKPFAWYGNFFLRVTQAISRAQELAADRLAAQVAGARSMIDALVSVERAGMAYDAFFQNELIPVLSNGFKPPIAAGFSKFLAAENVASSLTSAVDESLREGKGDIYDSHPPLRERVAALQSLATDAPATPEPLASSLRLVFSDGRLDR